METLGDTPSLPMDLPDSEPTSDNAPALSETEATRVIEALLFASDEPLTPATLKEYVGEANLSAALDALKQRYSSSGIVLMQIGQGYALRTAEDLEWLFEARAQPPRKLTKAATETLAIIAYHQPVTRSEIEDIRGVSASKGTLDVLLETGWIQMRGRRRTPGRPVTYGTTPAFLDQFALQSVADLPGLDELKGAGLLQTSASLAGGPGLPFHDADAQHDAEDPLDEADIAAERADLALWPADHHKEAEDEPTDPDASGTTR